MVSNSIFAYHTRFQSSIALQSNAASDGPICKAGTGRLSRYSMCEFPNSCRAMIHGYAIEIGKVCDASHTFRNQQRRSMRLVCKPLYFLEK